MRLTTDTPKNNVEMALNLFYVKDKEVWVRGYGKDGTDISLFELSRDMVRWNIPSADLSISDDSYSMMMTEWLWEDIETAEHIIALLYQAGWVCAELRERLKSYEDTGLTPDEIVKMGMAYEDNKRYSGRLEERLKAYEEPRLRELAGADKEGRALVLPCKVGDTVYTLNQILGTDNAVHDRIFERKITGYSGNALNKVWLIASGNSYDFDIFPSEIGKTVFLTREEAEEALEARKDETS